MVLYILLLMLLAGCGSSQEERERDELTLSFASEPTTLDPTKAPFSSSSNIFYFLYDGLMRLHPDGSIKPSIAERVEISPDYKRFVFHIRECSWSNGLAVEAADFERSWKELIAPNSTSPVAQQLYCLKNGKAVHEGRVEPNELGVLAVNQKTLLVELDFPCPYFLEMTAVYNFFPAPPEGSDGSVTNGPFLLSDWSHTREITLKKNPLYWDSQSVFFNRVTILFIPDPLTELKLFKRGSIDWAGPPFSPTLPLDSITPLAESHGIHSAPILSTYFFSFNNERAPFDSRKVRVALSLSLPREAIVTHLAQGGEEPATHFTPRLMIPDLSLDDETLKALFAEGLKESKGKVTKPIEISYNISELHHNIALAIQQRWKQLFGIDVNLRGRDWRAHLAEIEKGHFDVARMQWRGISKDPIHFLEIFEDPHYPMQRTGWSNETYKALIKKARVTSSSAERIELLYEAEELLTSEMPIAPLFFGSTLYVKHPDLEDYSISDLGFVDFKWSHK